MPPIIHILETGSTNSCLKELLSKKGLEEGTILSTNHQTSGRGQRGNGWESQEGKNLTFSMVLYPTFVPIDRQFILSQIVSLAIKDTLNKYTTDIITVKWPNDIYWQERKICGILIENSLCNNKIENCIIGIGININQEVFKSDAPNPVSLKNITGSNHDLETILTSIQKNILRYYAELKKNNIQTITDGYKASLFRKDGYHKYQDSINIFEAKIKDIEYSGHLNLETTKGEIRRFAFKEVKYIL